MEQIKEMSISDVSDRTVGLALERVRVISLLWRGRPTGRFIAKVPQDCKEMEALSVALEDLRGELTHGDTDDHVGT